MPARGGGCGIFADRPANSPGAFVPFQIIGSLCMPLLFVGNQYIIRFNPAVSCDNYWTEAETI
jgi:hypothetical protein